MLRQRHELIKMKVAILFVLSGMLLVSGVSVRAQKNLDVCRVTTSIWSIEGKIGTGIYEVGKFPVDDFEYGAAKDFSYESDGNAFSIRSEVEYGDFPAVEKGKPILINLSLDVFEANAPSKRSDFGAVEAGATYRYKWGTVVVRKDVVKGDRVYTFTLTCSDGISKGGVQRGAPKWLQKKRKT